MPALSTSGTLIVFVSLIAESPVSIECRVKQKTELGSHVMFIADVLCVHAAEELIDENNKFCLNKAGMLVYSHGEYMGTGETLGNFGFSVRKKKKTKTNRQ